uniref:NADH-ubiquinone oxidoreductase chain 2 n=1 Tax=Chaetoderma nitidulum TaxID=256131 RepID=D3G6D8_CHANT|nr:NADH dehydrogenase subunit 2 [Chaetoderma nitidulum]ABM69286.1 NADH dehydrogenase subunit 2 [Chaetoderma nitidulum]
MFPLQLFFSSFMILGTFLMLFSPNYVSIWVGLELNFFGFLPLMADMKETQTLEASMKYFLVQAFGSSIFLTGLFLLTYSNFMNTNFNFPHTLMILAISVKLGIAPFYFWLPSVMSGLSWKNCILLNTFQKFGPMLLFTHLFSWNSFILMMIITTSLIGGMMGMSQTQVRSILAYSSLVHMSWILSLGFYSLCYMLLYMFIYFILSSLVFMHSAKKNSIRISSTTPKKLSLLASLLSLGGMPPFTGFSMKLLGLQILISEASIMLTSMLVLSSLLSLYFYLNLLFSWMSQTSLSTEILTKTESVMIITMSFGLT